jgi:hypothetical protein
MRPDDEQTSPIVEQELGSAFIAAGIGSTALGLVTTLAEVNASFRDSLFWFARGGPLGGKTSIAVLSFLVTWAVLTLAFRRRPVGLKTAFIIALVLIAMGLLLTFPPIFRAIAQLF